MPPKLISRPHKASEITNRLADLDGNQQYHQMCGRTKVMPPLARKRCKVIPPPVSGETRHHVQSNPAIGSEECQRENLRRI